MIILNILQITKLQVDGFEVGKLIPNVQVRATCPSEEKVPHDATVLVKLVEAVQPCIFININLPVKGT